MPTNCPSSGSAVFWFAAVLSALVLAGCGGPAEITPTTPTADEIRATEQALEAAAAAERPATAPAAK